jgi:uncharacterized cupin superfamily protein
MIKATDNAYEIDMDKVPFTEIGGPIVGMKAAVRIKWVLSDAAGIAGIEDFEPGSEHSSSFWYDEMHFVIDGEAEISFTLPPLNRKIMKTTARRGDSYLLLRGTKVTWKITSKEPYRHLCVIMPRTEIQSWLRHEQYDKLGI